MTRRLRYLILIVILVPTGSIAFAQEQGLTLPAPPRQYSTPVPSYQPGAPPAGYNMEVLPQQETTPPTPAPVPSAAPAPFYPQSEAPAPPPRPAAPPSAPYTSNQLTVLPPVFRGCWEGTVSNLDSIQAAPGAHKLGYWTTKTYRLCYKQVGNGPFQLTFGQTGIVASQRIKDSGGRVSVLATDGRSWARMRAFLHFDEFYENYNAQTFAVDEVTMLECSIRGDSMSVSAHVTGRREDEPWFEAYWHTTFVKVPM
jgi:hypothetical protein